MEPVLIRLQNDLKFLLGSVIPTMHLSGHGLSVGAKERIPRSGLEDQRAVWVFNGGESVQTRVEP
jgi:hypothetical protein